MAGHGEKRSHITPWRMSGTAPSSTREYTPRLEHFRPGFFMKVKAKHACFSVGAIAIVLIALAVWRIAVPAARLFVHRSALYGVQDDDRVRSCAAWLLDRGHDEIVLSAAAADYRRLHQEEADARHGPGV
jgi:hypothetical protein